MRAMTVIGLVLAASVQGVSLYAGECTPDGGTCKENSDCCSGDCDWSMMNKYCFPKSSTNVTVDGKQLIRGKSEKKSSKKKHKNSTSIK